MKGFRTIIVNAGIGAGTAALQYLVGFDWVSAVGEAPAMLIVAILNIALRWVTNTPVGQKEPVMVRS